MADRDMGMTVADAAVQLGISKEAIRKRVHRGTLPSGRDADGTVRVYMPPSSTASSTPSSELTDELREQIDHLKGEVEYLREEHRRKDHIIAGLVQRVPELESGERSDDTAPQRPEGDPGSGPDSPSEDRERGSQRSIWQRLFGRE